MALISCPECTRSVSDAAVVCPQCGFPLRLGDRKPVPGRQGQPQHALGSESVQNARKEIRVDGVRSVWALAPIGCFVGAVVWFAGWGVASIVVHAQDHSLFNISGMREGNRAMWGYPVFALAGIVVAVSLLIMKVRPRRSIWIGLIANLVLIVLFLHALWLANVL